MKRNAFKMKLKKGFEEEYKKRHDEIWPELLRVLEDAGICDYSIYLDRETGILFAFQIVDDNNEVDKLPQNPIVQKWWDMMGDIMDTNPDNSPESTDLTEVFRMGNKIN
jgi:L-rhamnose mutarotase